MKEEEYTLAPGEPHPAADGALRYILGLGIGERFLWRETFASCAIEDNRHAAICLETLRRIEDRKPVSDRYLLGLAWTIREGSQ